MEDKVSNSIENLSDEFFTFIAKLSVDVFALDQEHVHSDLEWHLTSDLENGCLIHVDFGLEFFSLESRSWGLDDLDASTLVDIEGSPGLENFPLTLALFALTKAMIFFYLSRVLLT